MDSCASTAAPPPELGTAAARPLGAGNAASGVEADNPLSPPPGHSAHTVDLSSNEPLSQFLYAPRAGFSASTGRHKAGRIFRTPQGLAADQIRELATMPRAQSTRRPALSTASRPSLALARRDSYSTAFLRASRALSWRDRSRTSGEDAAASSSRSAAR